MGHQGGVGRQVRLRSNDVWSCHTLGKSTSAFSSYFQVPRVPLGYQAFDPQNMAADLLPARIPDILRHWTVARSKKLAKNSASLSPFNSDIMIFLFFSTYFSIWSILQKLILFQDLVSTVDFKICQVVTTKSLR